jgi:hypothetical protein
MRATLRVLFCLPSELIASAFRLTRRVYVENLSKWQHLATIRKEGKIYTTCGVGKIPLVSAKDIAATAFHAFTDVKPHNTEYRILGPELLTYDQVCCFFVDSEPQLDAKTSLHGGDCGQT